MDPIDRLMEEHQTILRVLDALEAYAVALGGGADEDRARLGRFVTFIRELADRIHHGKEEEILFAVMVEHGFPRQAGPIAVMLHEHDVGRGLVGQLATLAERPAWSLEDRREAASTARELVRLLSDHIAKEDQILYPMARARLPPAALQRVAEACDAAAARDAEDTRRLLALAEELAPAGG